MKRIINRFPIFFSAVTGLLLASAVLFSATGCSTFKGKQKTEKPVGEKTAFTTAREEQSNLSEFVASAGRKNPKEKKDVHPGQTFLLSDKAKEIYRNTER